MTQWQPPTVQSPPRCDVLIYLIFPYSCVGAQCDDAFELIKTLGSKKSTLSGSCRDEGHLRRAICLKKKEEEDGGPIVSSFSLAIGLISY